MSDFTFDPKLSADENIVRFYTHLGSIDPELTNLLKTNIALLIPLPEAAAQKTLARKQANMAIATALDTPSAEADGSK